MVERVEGAQTRLKHQGTVTTCFAPSSGKGRRGSDEIETAMSSCFDEDFESGKGRRGSDEIETGRLHSP